ncbi:Casparian strip membrane protein domain [Dillenia turbinata]|uniref:CASP-like protein n=1 Tax=Dillenia turbinata TaxID=194707 RepID=A0AAN8VGL4_9MAGN
MAAITNLVLRLLTFIFLLISLIILAANSETINGYKFRFDEIHSYQYAIATIALGFVYTLVQIGFTIFEISSGKPLISGDGLLYFNFYADKAISYILATGAGAAFGATVDLKAQTEGGVLDKFFERGSAAASFLFFAFLTTAVLSILSSLAVPKKL